MIGLELLLGDFYRFIAGRIFVVCRQRRCGCRSLSPAARCPLASVAAAAAVMQAAAQAGLPQGLPEPQQPKADFIFIRYAYY